MQSVFKGVAILTADCQACNRPGKSMILAWQCDIARADAASRPSRAPGAASAAPPCLLVNMTDFPPGSQISWHCQKHLQALTSAAVTTLASTQHTCNHDNGVGFARVPLLDQQHSIPAGAGPATALLQSHPQR